MNEQGIIVDANQLIGALLGGRALDIIYSERFHFFTTERKTWEVKRYIPFIASKVGVSEEDILRAFELFPVVACQDTFFNDHIPRAFELIGARDPTDVDLLALALRLQYPVWSHDQDFLDLKVVEVIATEELLAHLASEGTS